MSRHPGFIRISYCASHTEHVATVELATISDGNVPVYQSLLNDLLKVPGAENTGHGYIDIPDTADNRLAVQLAMRCKT